MSNIPVDNGFEDNVLVSLAKGGDTSALSLLINRYSDKVLLKAKSFKALSGLENEDLYQEGMLGFISAVYSFDEGHGTLFSTYASTLCARKMLSALRKQNSNSNLPLRSYISIEDDCNILSDSPSPEELVIFNEEIDEVSRFIEKSFSRLEKKTFKLSLLSLSYAEIADILDSNEKSVNNTMQRIRRKLQAFKESKS